MNASRWSAAILLFGIISLSAFSWSSRGSIVFDANTFYFSDGLKTETTANTNRLFYNLFLGFSLDRKGAFQVGWSYANYSTTDKDASTTKTYSSTQMGPGLLWYFDKRRQWRVGLYYHLKVDGKYSVTGSNGQEWRGSAFAGDIGYQIYMSPTLALGARLNYSSSAYNESFEATSKTDISYSRAILYPSFALTFEF